MANTKIILPSEPQILYIKNVNLNELNFYIRACNADLTPKLVKYTKSSDNIQMVMEKFPETLSDVIMDSNRKEEVKLIIARAKILIEKLHEIGILHGDLSEENIVYDKNIGVVALIDFGMSKNISDLTNNDIEQYAENFGEGAKYAQPKSNDIQYVLRLELGILDFLLNYVS